jgi:hypothetical protein
VLKLSREDGFTLSEMLVSTAVLLLVTGTTLTTMKNAVMINDAAGQLGDSAQNIRAGTNLLIRDLMMAGRIIGAEGVAMPNGAGVHPFNRPGPVTLTFNLVTTDVDDTGNTEVITMNLPSITTGYQLGPKILGTTAAASTDMVTIMTVDEFVPTAYAPPQGVTATDATIATDGSNITMSATADWMVGNTVTNTKAIQVGDLLLFKNQNGNALKYVTRTDTTHLYFDNTGADPFGFNQAAVSPNYPMLTLKGQTSFTTAPWSIYTSIFRAMMITYYVDNTTTPGTPRLIRQMNWPLAMSGTPPTCGYVNCFQPTALAGVVEDLDLTYDLVDGVTNPAAVPSLPWTNTAVTPNVSYDSNQIRKVNLHVGVRSEQVSKPTQSYVRIHMNTSVDARSMATVDRYTTSTDIQ